MVYGTCLENKRGETYREFESHRFRRYARAQKYIQRAIGALYWCYHNHMPRTALFEWDGKEYASEERGADWYWALGIVTVAAALVAILFSNVLLALVILAGASTVALQAAKHRRTHHFSILDNGIAIDDNLYLYEDMRDFAILEYLDESLPDALSIKTNHLLAPHLLIPIHDYDPVTIYEYITNHLPEGRHEETMLDRVTAALRF